MAYKKFRITIKGFTLAEVLIVLVILGFLVLLALPSLMPVISRAKSMEAQLQLEHLYTLEKTYFYTHSRYSQNLKDLGFEQSKLTSEDGQANYKIEIIEASNSNFKAQATAIVDFDVDGVFNIWEVDDNKNIKETTPD